jgi:sulfoxide reductase catalytic subunit YedY
MVARVEEELAALLMIAFDAAHRAVHYPPDRRFRIWIRPSILIGVAAAMVALIAAAWIEVAVTGMPPVPAVPQIYPNNFAGPHGFPMWVRYCHFFNFLFVMILIRSGLSILMDHPRLYFNDGCTPGSEWIRFTPVSVPLDRIWTAKDDARYISPLIGTPGYRHTIGLARAWHFIDVHGFIATGIVFLSCSSPRNSGNQLCRLRRSFSCRHGIPLFRLSVKWRAGVLR